MSYCEVYSLQHFCFLKLAEFLKKGKRLNIYLPVTLRNDFYCILKSRNLLNDDTVHMVMHEKSEEARLFGDRVTDKAVSSLMICADNLKKLDLTFAGTKSVFLVSDKCICRLFSSCSKLEEVRVTDLLSLTDRSVSELAKNNPKLCILDLSHCILIGDDSLKKIGEYCENLEAINVSYTSISDKGIDYLVKGKSNHKLKEILMAGCRQLTDASIEAVVDNCPNMAIFTFHFCPLVTDRAREAVGRIGGSARQISWTVY